MATLMRERAGERFHPHSSQCQSLVFIGRVVSLLSQECHEPVSILKSNTIVNRVLSALKYHFLAAETHDRLLEFVCARTIAMCEKVEIYSLWQD